MAAKLVVEMDGDLPGYAKVHAAGCRDCHDPEPVGDTLADVAENWPWPEEVDDTWKAPLMPCASKIIRAAVDSALPADSQLWTVEKTSIEYDTLTGRPFLAATVHPTNDTGDGVASMTLSQYSTEAPGWAIDSLLMGNGYPVFVHGAGERCCRKRRLDGDHPMSRLLNAAAATLADQLATEARRFGWIN